MRAFFRLFAILVVCVLCTGGAARAEEPVDLGALLKTIAARQDQVEAFQKDVSYLETTRAELLDKHGKLETAKITVTRVTVKDGNTERTIVSTRSEGEDPTIKIEIEVGYSSPFSATAQPKHRFTVVGPVPEAPGKLRVRFEPTGSRAKAMVGDAIVDPATGDISSLSMTPAELPTMVDRMNVVIRYGLKSPAGLLPSVIDMSGEGGILFIKMRMKTHTELSEYTGGKP